MLTGESAKDSIAKSRGKTNPLGGEGNIVKKIRRIRMTTRTSKLVVVHQNKTASPETASGFGHSQTEICPTCGQRLTTALIEPQLLPPVICPNEHGEDET